MKDINKELCEYMHSFVSEHLDEITDSYESLGFKDSEDMLEQIKSNVVVIHLKTQYILNVRKAHTLQIMDILLDL